MENLIGFLVDFEKRIIDCKLLEYKQNEICDRERRCIIGAFFEGRILYEKGYSDDSFLMFYFALLHLDRFCNGINTVDSDNWDEFYKKTASGEDDYFQATYGISKPFIDALTKRNDVVHNINIDQQVTTKKDLLRCLYLINLVVNKILEENYEFDFVNIILVCKFFFEIEQEAHKNSFNKTDDKIAVLIDKSTKYPQEFIQHIEILRDDERFYKYFGQCLRKEIIENMWLCEYCLPESLYDFYATIFSLDQGKDIFKLVNNLCYKIVDGTSDIKYLAEFVNAIWKKIPKCSINSELEMAIDYKLSIIKGLQIDTNK